jgi:hypothetical protein
MEHGGDVAHDNAPGSLGRGDAEASVAVSIAGGSMEMLVAWPLAGDVHPHAAVGTIQAPMQFGQAQDQYGQAEDQLGSVPEDRDDTAQTSEPREVQLDGDMLVQTPTPSAPKKPTSRFLPLPPRSAVTLPTFLARIDAALESGDEETEQRKPSARSFVTRLESPHIDDSVELFDHPEFRLGGGSNESAADEESDNQDGISGAKSSEEDIADGLDNEEYVPSGDEDVADMDDQAMDEAMDDDMDANMDSDDDGKEATTPASKVQAKKGKTKASLPSTVQKIRKPVQVPAPRTVHANWDDWAKYLPEYMASTRQVLAVKTTLNCKLRNKRLADTVAAQQGRHVPYVPEGMEIYERCYICTHGWTKKSRSKGQRPRQFTRGSKCPFRFIVQLEEGDEGWELVVKNGVFQHNHALEKRHFKTYSSSRGIAKAENKSAVAEMVKHGRKRSAIYDYLLEQGENVIQKDVDNLVQTLQAASSGDTDDADATAIVLAKFTAKDGCVATVDETEAGETGVISISSRHMRTIFSRFPELLLIDCTHKTNR